MGNSVFYNRIKESKQLINYIGSQNDKENKIILLEGKTGVGKSGLVRKILNKELVERASIWVEVSKSSPDTIENLHYINIMYRTFSELAKKRFFDDIPTPFQQGILSFKNLFHFGLGILWSKSAGEENRLYEPTVELSVLRKKSYIINLLKKHHYIVDIENIQNIDTQSLEILKDILVQIEGTTFILEYTTDNGHMPEHFSSFYNELCTFNAQVSPFKIKMLDFDEAKKLAPEGVPEGLLWNIYKQCDGNLVKVILSNSATDEYDDPIQTRLETLTKDEYFLVNLIYLNGLKTEVSLIYQILIGNLSAPPFSQFTINSCLRHLKELNVIHYYDEGAVKIFHDSILEELERQKVNPILFTAFNILKTYYTEKLQEREDEYTVEQLFRLYIKFSDDEVVSIFPYIKRLIKSYKYPQPIVNKLIYYREELTRKEGVNYTSVYEMSLFLTVICLELGLSTEAQKNLELIYLDQNPYHRALQTAIYTLDFTSDSSMEKAELLAKRAQTPRENLVMQLCLLSGKMARLSAAQSAMIVEELLAHEEYQKLFEYAYLLRDYAELVQNYAKSIELYMDALCRFQSCGRTDLCSEVLVSLSMFHAYKGEIKKAQKLLLDAQKIGNVPEYFILNNLAVLDILEESPNERTARNLSDALLITNDIYEKIIIMCNLLVCYIQLQDCERAKQMLEMIEIQEYSKFQYEEFLHIVYQNIYYYHCTFGNAEKATEFKKRLCELVDRTPGTMAHRIAKLQLENKHLPEEFYSNFAFRVDFLGNWSIEISRELEHY